MIYTTCRALLIFALDFIPGALTLVFYGLVFVALLKFVTA